MLLNTNTRVCQELSEGTATFNMPISRKSIPDVTAGKRLILFFCGICVPPLFFLCGHYSLKERNYQVRYQKARHRL